MQTWNGKKLAEQRGQQGKSPLKTNGPSFVVETYCWNAISCIFHDAYTIERTDSFISLVEKTT
jgi:hypothetical protein